MLSAPKHLQPGEGFRLKPWYKVPVKRSPQHREAPTSSYNLPEMVLMAKRATDGCGDWAEAYATDVAYLLRLMRRYDMPKAMEKALRAEARKKWPGDKEKQDAYVYGALRKTGWKPSTQKSGHSKKGK